ncbi:unnamed protein product [Acanthoscelides obtectus]|uniref:Uncharacterized protein n=1 Tax=Acanthoscelides obtectus TaxID=200917 RepID=A0A9P0P3L0_ACAOB|nr:unnamed protein product [Acanthoscelides obtectus]CAK1633143.1 hypothetical protein AOBTE_LOCUS7966 [Acanthoscelides obtectus]
MPFWLVQMPRREVHTIAVGL